MSWFRKTPEQIEIGNWYVGWPSWKFEITYNDGGLIRENHFIDISLFGWHSRFILPWKSEGSKSMYIAKEYGISIHNNTVFFHWRYDLKRWGIPFFDYGQCVRRDIYKGSKTLHPDYWRAEDWEPYDYYHIPDYITKFEGDFIDYDGEVIPCTYTVQELEWRPKWLKWTSMFARVKREIDISFSREAGPNKGSWSGGVLGFGFIMKDNETPQECFKRFTKEAKL